MGVTEAKESKDVSPLRKGAGSGTSWKQVEGGDPEDRWKGAGVHEDEGKGERGALRMGGGRGYTLWMGGGRGAPWGPVEGNGVHPQDGWKGAGVPWEWVGDPHPIPGDKALEGNEVARPVGM